MSINFSYDFLIVGQGLAGSITALMLEDAGYNVMLIEEGKEKTSSRVAAGIFHPVTGRRIVFSWKARELYDYATSFYERTESKLGEKFFHRKLILEVMGTAREYNDWQGRLAQPEFSRLHKDEAINPEYDNCLQSHAGKLLLGDSGWMDITRFLSVTEKHFSEQGKLTKAKFIPGKLERIENGYRYELGKFQKIIFCEGIDSFENLFWNYLPFNPARGEILNVSIPGLPEDHIIMSGIFILPLGNSVFRIGSTYSWNYPESKPTEQGLMELEKKLREAIRLPYKVLDHQAGIRPTVLDRRPLVGKHPEKEDMYILNGLGTKGVMLGPYFAHELIENIQCGKAINSEADIARYSHLFFQSGKSA